MKHDKHQEGRERAGNTYRRKIATIAPAIVWEKIRTRALLDGGKNDERQKEGSESLRSRAWARLVGQPKKPRHKDTRSAAKAKHRAQEKKPKRRGENARHRGRGNTQAIAM